jgi:DNA-binding transcriptional MocR family regulator
MLETRPRLLYLVPSFHNPTGTLLPERSRRVIARLAAEFQVPVVEDNALAGLGLGAALPPPIAAFAKNAPILSIGSPSKLFWSGLRVGWIRGPEALIARLGRWKALADLGSPLHTQAIVLHLLAEEAAAEKLRCRESSTMPTSWLRLPSATAWPSWPARPIRLTIASLIGCACLLSPTPPS